MFFSNIMCDEAISDQHWKRTKEWRKTLEDTVRGCLGSTIIIIISNEVTDSIVGGMLWVLVSSDSSHQRIDKETSPPGPTFDTGDHEPQQRLGATVLNPYRKKQLTKHRDRVL